MQNAQYTYMTRQQLAIRAGIDRHTLYIYINSIWAELEKRGCQKRKLLTPAGVEYICQNYGIIL